MQVRSPRPPRQRVDGVLLLDKPSGLSSNAALQRARRAFNAEKAGHTGTLDPLASGLLPLCFGEATKFARFLLDADKRYTATVRFGAATTTQDAEGDVVATAPVARLDRAAIEAALPAFRGTILHGFVDELTAEMLSDHEDAFALVVAHDLTTQFFAHIGANGLATSEDTLQLARPMQIDTIAQTRQQAGGNNTDLNYAYPPEQALLHNDGNGASAFVRYDLDALLVNGFDEVQR